VADTEKKDRRRRIPGASKTMDQAAESGAAKTAPGAIATEPEAEDGLPPNLQAHIGRHLRAMFDEVAREPIPDRLLQLLKDLELQLLKDLERSGDK
jgi:Anti-sigma factor NepR